jgi:O-antigen/teichoic acid export membrane protein
MNLKLGHYLNGFFSEGSTLLAKTAKGVVWRLASFSFNKVLSFVTTIILARLLVPADFGIVAIAHFVLNSMELVGAWGMDAALIKENKKINETKNAVFFASIFISFSVFLISFIISPFASSFFNSPASLWIIRAMAFASFIKSFHTVPSAMINKELMFKQAALAGWISAVLRTGFIILLAFKGFGPWSLVYGNLLGSVLDVIIAFVLFPFKPSFNFDFSVLKGVFSFGGHMFLATVIIFLINQGDSAFIGKFLGATMLGFYTLAYNLSNLPAINITHVISQVIFPAYSKINDNKEKMRRAYFKTLQFISLLSLPASLGIFILAPEIVRLIYGEKWLSIIIPVQIMCFFGMIRSIAGTTGEMFKSVGKPVYLERVSLVQLLIMAVIIYPLTMKWGIVGTSLAVLIPMALVQWWAFYKVGKILDSSLLEIGCVLSAPLASSLVMCAIIFMAKSLLPISNIFYLFSYVFVGALVYFACVFVIRREYYEEIKEAVSSLIK